MKYIPYEITERTKKTIELYKTLPVASIPNAQASKTHKMFGTGDRMVTLAYLRGWEKHKDAPTTKLRASLAEAENLYNSKPVIYDHEILLGHLYLPQHTKEEQEEYDRLCESFNSFAAYKSDYYLPRKCHIGLDFDLLLEKGVEGLINEIQAKRDALDFNVDIYPDFEVMKKDEFYECCLIELNAVLDLAERYSASAKELAEKSPEPRKSELLKLSEILKNVPKKPAKTFYEAIQSVQFYLSTLFGLFTLARPDRYLYKFYEQDIKNGTLTKEFAQELIDNFCLYVSDRVFSRSACGFLVGGQEADGTLVENDLTYMFITALHHIKMPDPNGALAVNKKTSDDILEYATYVLADGTSHPAFYNDEEIINSLVNNYGVKREDAVKYIHATCAEMSVAGCSKSHSTPYSLNLPGDFQKIARENPSASSVDELLDLLIEDMQEKITRHQKSYAMKMLEGSRIGNDPMRVSVLINDCIEKGKSHYESGERYAFVQPILCGFATLVDSFVALDELVFKQKKLTINEFIEIIDKNYEGSEDLRQYIINKIPHYGNCDEVADKAAEKIINAIMTLFEGNKLPMNKYMMPGTFTYVAHANMGKIMGATFDGRKSNFSLSDGCSPVQGRDIKGPTAMVSSLTSWDQSRLLGGMVVNIKFNKGNLDGEKAKNFIAILKTFIDRGGIEIQVNCVDRETLLDAVKNPEAHGDLMVRIGGYSDYFTRQNETMQQEIIARTQY